MKKAINAWTIPGGASFEEMFRAVSEAGFEGIELNLDGEGASAHSLTMDAGKSVYDRINALAARHNLPVCSVSTSMYGGLLGSDKPEEREEGKRVLRKQLECAAALGADGILVVPGGIDENTSILKAYENSRRSLSEMVPEIERAGIRVGLENVWNGFFASPFVMADFIDGFGCPLVGAYFDVGNVAVHSYPEYWIEILGKRIMKVHVKDFQLGGWWHSGSFVNLLQGSIRWGRVADALAAAGYDGFVTAELGTLESAPDYLYDITSKALDIILKR